MLSTLNRCSNLLQKAVGIFCATLVAILTILTFCGVIWRFVLNNPIVWLYELTLILFSWIIFLGFSLAFRTDEHIALNFLESKLQGTAFYILRQFIYLIALVFLIIVIKEGGSVVQSTWNQTYNTIPLPKGLFYLSFPVGAVVASFQIICCMCNLHKNTPSISNDPNTDLL